MKRISVFLLLLCLVLTLAVPAFASEVDPIAESGDLIYGAVWNHYKDGFIVRSPFSFDGYRAIVFHESPTVPVNSRYYMFKFDKPAVYDSANDKWYSPDGEIVNYEIYQYVIGTMAYGEDGMYWRAYGSGTFDGGFDANIDSDVWVWANYTVNEYNSGGTLISASSFPQDVVIRYYDEWEQDYSDLGVDGKYKYVYKEITKANGSVTADYARLTFSTVPATYSSGEWYLPQEAETVSFIKLRYIYGWGEPTYSTGSDYIEGESNMWVGFNNAPETPDEEDPTTPPTDDGDDGNFPNPPTMDQVQEAVAGGLEVEMKILYRTMMILALCGVTCLTLLIILKLFGKWWTIFSA